MTYTAIRHTLNSRRSIGEFMIRFLTLSISTLGIIFLVTGCGNELPLNQVANPTPVNDQIPVAPPANILSSSSNGKPLTYAVQYPDLVPSVQCPDADFGSGLVICHTPSGNSSTPSTLCINDHDLQTYLSYKLDYLGPCTSTSSGDGK